MSSVVRTYGSLYASVLGLTAKAIGRRWPWLLVAPVVEFLVARLTEVAVRAAGSTVGGLLAGLLYAVGISVLLFVGRGILEMRRMNVDDLLRGWQGFVNDTMSVLFVFWIASLPVRYAPPLAIVLLLVPLVLPIFEMVALAPVGGYGVFEVAWRFFQRDFGPWLVGQLPAIALVVGGLLAQNGLLILLDQVPGPELLRLAVLTVVRAVPVLAAFVAFLYRGVLFLTLDGTRPQARHVKYGGDAGLGR